MKEYELEGLKALGRAFRSEINRSDSRPDFEISRGITRVAAAGTAAGCQRKEAPLIAWVGLQQDVVGVRRGRRTLLYVVAGKRSAGADRRRRNGRERKREIFFSID